VAVAWVAPLTVAACVNTDLARVKYDGPPLARSSEKSAAIRMTTGAVDVDQAPIALVPERPKPGQYFNLDDQRVFGDSLKEELNRLNVLRVREVAWQDTAGGEDVLIEVIFQRTLYFPRAQRYILDVVMRLKSGEHRFARRYQVYSSEGESLWTNINTDVGQGKALAAKKLMARLIADIDKFMADPD
jgi:hypothetical protein